MKFRTEVEVKPFPFDINYSTPTFFCGSCFTNNIGGIVQKVKMPVLINPFGVVYNPFSVALVVQKILNAENYSPDDLTYNNGLWLSFDHYTKFSDTDKTKCLDNINLALDNAKDFFNKTNVLIITFGTARVYELKSTGNVVANCHKLPAKEFNHRLLGVDEIVSKWETLINTLIKKNPSVKIIFTVSPIRHWKDGAVGNMLSKAILTTAIHRLIEKFKNVVFYFPSYEIMMDDLRDYRFYNDDMLHPSQQAIEYIWQKFSNAVFNSETLQLVSQIQSVIKAANHRPLNPNTAEHQKFVKQTLSDIDNLQKQHSNLNFDEEINLLSS